MALRIAVLISGTGSNLRAIFEAIEAERCDAHVCAVLSDKSKAKGLALAHSRGVPTDVVLLKRYPDRAVWNEALADAIAAHAPDLVVLAGFMKIVGQELIDRFPSRIINVHPSLLPAFPGADGPAQAIAAGVRISGCTVHLVDRGVDSGPILAQAAVPVARHDDASRLHARIQQAEHALLPAVIDAIAQERMTLAPPSPFDHEPEPDSSALFSPARMLFRSVP